MKTLKGVSAAPYIAKPIDAGPNYALTLVYA